MAKPNPTRARAGKARRFSVTVARKGLMRHVATLHDRLDAGWDGIDFKGITGRRASLAAWEHATRILEREGSFDARGFLTI